MFTSFLLLAISILYDLRWTHPISHKKGTSHRLIETHILCLQQGAMI